MVSIPRGGLGRSGWVTNVESPGPATYDPSRYKTHDLGSSAPIIRPGYTVAHTEKESNPAPGDYDVPVRHSAPCSANLAPRGSEDSPNCWHYNPNPDNPAPGKYHHTQWGRTTDQPPFGDGLDRVISGGGKYMVTAPNPVINAPVQKPRAPLPTPSPPPPYPGPGKYEINRYPECHPLELSFSNRKVLGPDREYPIGMKKSRHLSKTVKHFPVSGCPFVSRTFAKAFQEFRPPPQNDEAAETKAQAAGVGDGKITDTGVDTNLEKWESQSGIDGTPEPKPFLQEGDRKPLEFFQDFVEEESRKERLAEKRSKGSRMYTPPYNPRASQLPRNSAADDQKYSLPRHRDSTRDYRSGHSSGRYRAEDKFRLVGGSWKSQYVDGMADTSPYNEDFTDESTREINNSRLRYGDAQPIDEDDWNTSFENENRRRLNDYPHMLRDNNKYRESFGY